MSDFNTNELGKISYDLRVPKSRIAVLIGTQGSIKKRIETEAGCILAIDSTEGDVSVTSSDVLKGFVAKDIVRAIGRGFNPDIALLLLRPDYSLEVIDLGEVTASKNSMTRIKGRIIGQQGRSRGIIEKLLDVHVSVTGKTISIIGIVEHVLAAKHAIDMLIEGAPHSTMYRWLEKKRKGLLAQDMIGPQLDIKDSFKKYLEPTPKNK
jgi:ribosomal RNA assembly protein